MPGRFWRTVGRTAALARVRGRGAIWVALCAGALAAGACAPAVAGEWNAERLYRDGIASDGSPIVGVRGEATSLSGADAACVVCHRRSGLGTAEGKSVIPPISGEHLFRPRNTNLAQFDSAQTSNVTRFRVPYDDASLARALREGVGSDGRQLSVLMPRYRLADQDLAALTGYLRSLGAEAAPGVTDEVLHFATIITPDADPAARDGMLATMRQFFQDRNHIIAGAARPLMHNDRGIVFRVTRRWELHEWVLTGPASTWQEQLRRRFAQEPVFAVISGAGGGDWSPVHGFCEAAHVPCLFPNVDRPVADDSAFFSVYYSRGVLLEAALLAEGIAGSAEAPTASATRHLVQVLRAGALSEAGAQRLDALMRARGWSSELRIVPASAGARELAQALLVEPGGALALWLGPDDIARLPSAPPKDTRVWLSGLLGGLEQMPLPDAWREASGFSYPIELPERRAVAMKLPEGWFRIKQIPITDLRTQVQTYIALQILSETVGEMQLSFVPEYLVERLEVMLSHRRFNGLYPRLSLGVGQRFASKGGYLAHFDGARKVVADGDWRTP